MSHRIWPYWESGHEFQPLGVNYLPLKVESERDLLTFSKSERFDVRSGFRFGL
jgi:hypothetical protein